MRLTCDYWFIISTHFLFNLPQKKVLYKGEHVSKIRDFKTRLVLTMKYNSTSQKILKLLLNIQIVISSNKIRLLQKNDLFIWSTSKFEYCVNILSFGTTFKGTFRKIKCRVDLFYTQQTNYIFCCRKYSRFQIRTPINVKS